MVSWQEAEARLVERLRATDRGQRMVFVASVATRLMAQHGARLANDQRPFTLSLRPLLPTGGRV
jgi:hypothetical protein